MSFQPGSVIECNELSSHGKMVVAVIGYARDWAAYEQSYPDQITLQDIADNGDKLSKDEARRLFPELNSLAYRP